MSPLGKFTFALIGLRIAGASGFLLGMLLGHIFIDRTIIIKKLEKCLSIIDDNIRLMLPYRFYKYYNRIDGNFWGKIWGIVLGSVLFGLNGLIVLFIIGHFTFDTPNSKHANKYRKKFDHFWNQNIGKISGGILGFVLKSKILVFSGVVIGFFIDYYRLEKGGLARFSFVKNFWLGINYLKLKLDSKQARHISFIQSAAGLAAKVAKADGVVSENEVRAFKRIFEIKEEDNSYIAKVFNDAKTSVKGYEKYAKQLKVIIKDNIELQENLVDNLFRIANADNGLSEKEFELMENISELLELPRGNFEAIRQRFEPQTDCSPMQNFYDILGVFCNASDCDVKKRWKELLNQFHPDKLQAEGASEEELEQTTSKVAEINNAYQAIMKSRKVA